MRIAALDIATKTGIAIGDSTDASFKASSWTYDSSCGLEGISLYEKMDNLFTELSDVFRTYAVEAVIYEGAYSGRNKEVFGYLRELHGACKMAAMRHGVLHSDIIKVTPVALKFYATGKVSSSKNAMLNAAQSRWPTMEWEDDNAVDAWWLLDMAITKERM